MKSYRYKFLSFLLIGLFFVTSCSNEELLELNQDPNAAAEIDPAYMLATAQLQVSGDRYETWRGVLIYSATMIQHMAALPGYWSGDKYLYNAQYSGALYERAYPGYVKLLAAVLEETADQPELANVNAVAKIMWVLGMSRLTDMYGDIPYFQAGRGFYDNVYSPTFDPQSEIYADMLQKLEEATAALDPSLEGFGNGGVQDLIYNGDLEKWRKFANSLMLRLGMRLTKVDPGLAQQYVQRAISGGVMESNADIAYLEHTDGPAGINQSGIGMVFMADANQRLSSTFVDHLSSTGDPRLEVFATTNEDGEYRGLPNGYDATTIREFEGTGEEPVSIDRYSTTNPAMTRLSSPNFFQTYAEVEFLLAEAAIRGWHNGDAAMHYENGVRAAMEYLTIYDESLAISSEDIDAYLAANPFNAAEGMRMIGEQYWIVTFLNEYEAWANWRRTGFPALTPVNYPGNISNGQIPRRLRYFEAEYGNNGDALNNALQRMGPDEFTTRMWWDAE